MEKLSLNTEIFLYKNIEELSDEDKKLVEAAQKVIKKAYAPYSKFFVAAAVLLENGEIITGTNQENSAYPSGLCAERVALFYANSQYPNVPVKALAVCAYTNGDFIDTAVPPCGACRQVMLETEIRFKTPIRVILYGKQNILVIKSAKDLLPLSFTNEFLR